MEGCWARHKDQALVMTALFTATMYSSWKRNNLARGPGIDGIPSLG